MITNKLFPLIEEWLNELIYGFSKEQLNVGIMNGEIKVENIRLRPEKVNEKISKFVESLWVKGAEISRILINWSVMNFIGEKPIEILISDIKMINCFSLGSVVLNLESFVDNLKEIDIEYDPFNNNSWSILENDLIISQSSKRYFNKQFFKDEAIFNKLIENVIARINSYTKANEFLFNLTVTNFVLRFEDDALLKDENIVILVTFENFHLSRSADGSSKKFEFKFDKLNISLEENTGVLIPSQHYLSFLDHEFNLDPKYYNYLKTIDFKQINRSAVKIIDDFNFFAKMSLKEKSSGAMDFFAAEEKKKLHFNLNFASSELNVNLTERLLSKLVKLLEIHKTLSIIKNLQDYKPMRKPMIISKENGAKLSKKKLLAKKYLQVRDWYFYLVWSHRIKKALNSKVFKNPLHEEFNNIMNIFRNLSDFVPYEHFEQKQLEEVTFDLKVLLKGIKLKYEGSDEFTIVLNGISNFIHYEEKQYTIENKIESLTITPGRKILIDGSGKESTFAPRDRLRLKLGKRKSIHVTQNDDSNNDVVDSVLNELFPKDGKSVNQDDLINSLIGTTKKTSNNLSSVINEMNKKKVRKHVHQIVETKEKISVPLVKAGSKTSPFLKIIYSYSHENSEKLQVEISKTDVNFSSESVQDVISSYFGLAESLKHLSFYLNSRDKPKPTLEHLHEIIRMKKAAIKKIDNNNDKDTAEGYINLLASEIIDCEEEVRRMESNYYGNLNKNKNIEFDIKLAGFTLKSLEKENNVHTELGGIAVPVNEFLVQKKGNFSKTSAFGITLWNNNFETMTSIMKDFKTSWTTQMETLLDKSHLAPVLKKALEKVKSKQEKKSVMIKEELGNYRVMREQVGSMKNLKELDLLD